MRTLVVIPTYNERANIEKMARAVLGLGVPDLGILFVDDNSPDGTGTIADELSREDARVRVLHRERKEGLGRAYLDGFVHALALGAERVIQMDCDFSHNPKDIEKLLASDGDLVIGSRYVPGGATPGWPFKRRLISRLGGLFIRVVTHLPVRDPTGGFKCWKAALLRDIDFNQVSSKGYSFQLEMNIIAWRKGAAIREVPIVFTDRVAGSSKITPGIALESIRVAWALRPRRHAG